MTIRKRGRTYSYRFWKRRVLYERGGYPTRDMAIQAEGIYRREVGANPQARGGMLVADAVAAYLSGRAHRPNASNERRTLRRFLRFTQCARLEFLTADEIIRYKQWRFHHGGEDPHTGKHRTITWPTVNRDLTYLSAFFNWCRRQRWLDQNPADSALVEREPEPAPDRVILSRQERQRLFTMIEHELKHEGRGPRTPNYRKERLKLELLYLLGVRKSVILHLRIEQIDWPSKTIHYRSKGREGVIALPPRAVRILRELIGKRVSGRVFAERTDATLRKLVQRARVRLRRPKLRIHDMRVNLARHLHDKGYDVPEIQAVLGHRTPEMTLRYIGAPTLRQIQRVMATVR